MKNSVKIIILFFIAILLMPSCLIISKAHYVTPESAGNKNDYYLFGKHTRTQQINKQLLVNDKNSNLKIYYDVPCWNVKKNDALFVDLLIQSDSLYIPDMYINGIVAEISGQKAPMQIDAAWLQIRTGNDADAVLAETPIDLYNTNYNDVLQNLKHNAALSLQENVPFAAIRMRMNKKIKDIGKENMLLNVDIDINGERYTADNVAYRRNSDYYVFTIVHAAAFAIFYTLLFWLEYVNDD